MKVIKHTQDESGFSVLVRDLNLSIDIWVDVYIDRDGDLMSDWNKYIFDTKNVEDLKVKNYQDSIDHFMDMTSCALTYLEKLELI